MKPRVSGSFVTRGSGSPRMPKLCDPHWHIGPSVGQASAHSIQKLSHACNLTVTIRTHQNHGSRITDASMTETDPAVLRGQDCCCCCCCVESYKVETGPSAKMDRSEIQHASSVYHHHEPRYVSSLFVGPCFPAWTKHVGLPEVSATSLVK